MDKSRDEYLHRLNVARFTRQLRDAPDPDRRRVLMSLLAEEGLKAKVHGWFPVMF